MSQLEAYLRLPWTVGVEHGDGEVILTVAELPGFFAAGRTEAEAESYFWEALASHLLSYVETGDEPPRPRRESRAQRSASGCDGSPEVSPEPGRHSGDIHRQKTEYESVAA